MADLANVNLRTMSPDDRASWFRQQLVKLPGEIVRIDDESWRVLQHNGALPQLLADLANGQLSSSICRDVNSRLNQKGWRVSESAEHDSRQVVHRVLILPEDGLIPPGAGDTTPIADAVPAPAPAGEVAETAEDELGVEDLKRAAAVMHWAAQQITMLRERCTKLSDSNTELRDQLRIAREKLEAANDAAQKAQDRQPPPRTVALFRDGISELSGLQQP